MANINRVVLVGNLTRDPELRHTPSGTAVCKLRVAVNTRQKDAATGEWGDKPNYFDVTVWGNQGENCAQYLSKGRPVGVDGRLDWREWEAQDGTKRQAVEIIADSVQFLGSRDERRRAASGSTCPRARRRDADFARRPAPTTTSRSRRHDGRADRNDAGRKRPPLGASERKRNCYFCKDKVDEVDYKNVNQLRRYISEKGKIRSRRITGACRRHQRQVAVAVKRAARDGAAALRRRPIAMEVILLPRRREGRPARRGRRRRAAVTRGTSCCRGGSPSGHAGEGRRAPKARRAARPPRGPHLRAGAGDRRTCSRKTVLRFEVKAGPTGCALRLRHADRHRRRDLAHAQGPRRPAQDRRSTSRSSASAATRCRSTLFDGRRRRGEDARRARGRRAAARGGARGDGGRRGAPRQRPRRRRPRLRPRRGGARRVTRPDGGRRSREAEEPAEPTAADVTERARGDGADAPTTATSQQRLVHRRDRSACGRVREDFSQPSGVCVPQICPATLAAWSGSRCGELRRTSVPSANIRRSSHFTDTAREQAGPRLSAAGRLDRRRSPRLRRPPRSRRRTSTPRSPSSAR